MSNQRRVNHTEERPARGQERRIEAPMRVPIDGLRNILDVHGIKPDMHPCWVNENQVDRFRAAGYTFVDYDGVTYGAYSVNQSNPLGARYAKNVGGGVYAYLMEIPQEIYDEDYRKQQAELDLKEAGIKIEARRQGLDHGDLILNK